MSEDWTQWLARNNSWIDPATKILSLFFGILVGAVLKPLRWLIPKMWNSWTQGPKTRITLRFVPIASHWQESSWNNKPSVTIVTIWQITKVPVPGSGSELPALLFNARLLGPLSKYVLNTQIRSGGRENSILPGKTCNVTILCCVSKIPKPDKVLKVRLVIEDQLEKKHKLRRVLVKSV
jgi:hypothetical protein